MSIVEVVRRTTTTVEIGHPGVQGPAGTGGGGGAVDSVNGQTGVVVLDATDVGADATGTASAALAAHVAAADPHSVYALESSLGTAAPLNVAASGDAASGEVVKGNDSRLTDSRTPTTHTHASTAISDSTAIGRTVLTAADAAAVRTAISVPSGSGTVSGTNTGDQTITLTGGVTGSGTGSFAATVVTNANLTGPVTSTGNATAIANGAISNAMLANGAVANLSGTNTGDETGARVATLLHAANNKTSLVDADEVNGTDSAASFGLIRTTWTNVKAFLKTYFDTLYQAILVSGTNIKTINSTSILGSGNLSISASPGGSTTQVQYNNAGAFAGSASFTNSGGLVTADYFESPNRISAPLFSARGNNATALAISGDSAGDYARAINVTGAPARYAPVGLVGGAITIIAGAGNTSPGTGACHGGAVNLAGGAKSDTGTDGAVNLGYTGSAVRGSVKLWAAIKADATNTAAGTTGAQTINKNSGTVNFAAGAASLVVTNSMVGTSSLVFCVVRTNDTTAVIKNVVPTAGSFTITLNAAATAETSVGFLVIN